ncbi:MAG: imidazoleglycerol-phosphate dehydratase HisB [Candidatus Bathyarchaeia archaeon]
MLKPNREAKLDRQTAESHITVWINLDGKGEAKVETGIKFLDHLITTLAKHALFDLNLKAEGDLKHHTCEDVALALGEAFNTALQDRRGVRRFGFAYVPMDDSLARAVVDLGGRPYIRIEFFADQPQIEDVKVEDLKHFFISFAQTSKSNIHLSVIYGENLHHKVEAAAKALALALKDAVTLEPRREDSIPSVKGVI